MLKSLLFLIFICLISLPVNAQETPPTIVEFAADVESISLAELEYSGTWIGLRWQIDGMTGNHRVVVEYYFDDSWRPLETIYQPTHPDPARPYFYEQQASHAMTIFYTPHPLNFEPVTFRLRVVDVNAPEISLAEQELTIPYSTPVEPPTIEHIEFSTPYIAPPQEPVLTSAELMQGSAELYAMWWISNRIPTSNLRFEQIMSDGSSQSVELPRDIAWTGSQGNGKITPLMPDAPGEAVAIRVQLFDVLNGTIYDEEIVSIPVVDTLPTPVVPPVIATVTSFTATPETVTEGDTITLSWEVQGTEVVNLAVDYPTRSFFDWNQLTEQPSAGSITLSVPTSSRFVQYYLPYTAGNVLTVIIQCRFSWFEGVVEPTYCPGEEAQILPMTYQLFQYGFMLEQAGRVWVIFTQGGGYFYDLSETDPALLEMLVMPEPPIEGYYQPQGYFGIVWASDMLLRESIGWATGIEESYQGQMQSLYFESPQASEIRYATLPNGAIINLNTYSRHIVNWMQS